MCLRPAPTAKRQPKCVASKASIQVWSSRCGDQAAFAETVIRCEVRGRLHSASVPETNKPSSVQYAQSLTPQRKRAANAASSDAITADRLAPTNPIGHYALVRACARCALLSAFVLAVGCSGSHKAAPPTSTFNHGLIPVPTTEVVAKPLQGGDIKHAVEVAQAIKASGLGCDVASLDWQGIPAAKRPPDLPEQVSCDVAGGNMVTVLRFKDHDALLGEASYFHQAVCASSPHDAVHYVAGSNWAVFPGQPDTNNTERRLASGLPGASQTLKC